MVIGFKYELNRNLFSIYQFLFFKEYYKFINNLSEYQSLSELAEEIYRNLYGARDTFHFDVGNGLDGSVNCIEG